MNLHQKKQFQEQAKTCLTLLEMWVMLRALPWAVAVEASQASQADV